MEKISGEDLVEMTNAVNELIDRLKTLEEENALQKKMIKFIMENAEPMVVPIKDGSLQDLWDEKKGIVRASEYNKAVNIPSCDGTSCNNRDFNFTNGDNGEPTDKSEKIEEIINEFDNDHIDLCKVVDIKDCCTDQILILSKNKIESWLRDKLNSL